MGFRNKIIGLAAAAAMTLGIFAGVGANTVNTPASVTLTGGQCTIAVSKSGFNFGTWKYDGASSTYVWQGNHSDSHNVVWTITEGTPKGCDITLTFTGLSNTTTNQSIGLENFSGSLKWVWGSVMIGPVTGLLNSPGLDFGNGFTNYTSGIDLGLEFYTGEPTFPTSTLEGNITLDQIPADTNLGLYTGTIKSEINNAQ